MPETRDGTAVSWPAVSAAVSLVTSRRGGADDAQADLIGDVPAGEVLAALEVITTALLDSFAPDACGDLFLQFLGLAAIEHGTRQPSPEKGGSRWAT